MKKKNELFLGRLRECQNGMNVSAFSRFLGLNQKTLDLYIKGERKPSVELISAICTKCGVSSDWLLGISNERNPGRQVVTATGGSVAAGGNATAHIHAPPPQPDQPVCPSSSDISRLLNIIESQQRVIESLAANTPQNK